jgi:3',5'-cyclic AMP phosphodiesterase CpdA
MRVVHLTDLHVERVPRVGELFNKRALGVVNLYVLGRTHHFSEASVRGAVEATIAAEPDLVVCTGDLTSTATEEEFEAARVLLEPILTRFPFRVVPGNHDVYTSESRGRFNTHFGPWSGQGSFPWVERFGAWDVVALDTARPALLSRGRAGPEMLARLDTLLGEGDAPAMVLLHYPLRNRHGAPYGPGTRNLEGAAALEAVLARHPRVRLVMHGHEHHGYATTLPGGARSLNPGAGGYAFLPKRGRTAHLNVLEVDDDGGVTVERLAWDGARFAPEPGGAYATGG